MRLPGTFNPGGRNQLPTAEFLIHYENLKRAKAEARLEREANGGDKAEFGDRPFPKRVTPTSKKDNNDARRNEKPSDAVLTPDGETFTKAQDDTIIQMKMEGKSWAMIGTEIGKEKGAVTHRFKDIKPSDFDVKEKEWKEKNGGGGGGGGGVGQNQGKQKKKGGNNQNENQNPNPDEKGNDHNDQQNNQQHEGKKKNKNKNNQQDNQNSQNNNQNSNQHWKKKEEAQAEAAAENNDGASEDGTWAVADENFTEKEVTVLEKIVEIELRNAFVRIAKSFALHPDGKRVHPDSIAQKVLGEGLDLSSLGG
ncbi:hypothetical protein BLS_008894 [Venturia inaequalis]|uniref:Myb-like domain-containing protein n=1 Tax=Venturia inaequalis TaxID=5025 RepID=A0A8H3V1B0_VENIN|nr:hypothetical protein BLS_008894 [Venturia inaequalis]